MESCLGLSSVQEAIDAIRRGGMVVVVDGPERENEGDLVMAAEFADAAAVNFMATHGRGLICVPMLRDRLDELGIRPMTASNRDPHGTAFHTSVDLAHATSTGISAADRAATIAALASSGSVAADFNQPGHVFPLAYAEGGVLQRPGHTEASVDLARLAGAAPAAVICEIARADGEMMRVPELREFARCHALPMVTIRDLAEYRRHHDSLVLRGGQARIPVAGVAFTMVGYRDLRDGREHLAMTLGDLATDPAPLIRVHSECLSGDVFGSLRCDCGAQLAVAMKRIEAEGAGAVVYVRGHEGRGIGLVEKLRAYDLQERGLDTVQANHALGHPADARDYGAAAEILRDLGVDALRLLTNNPDKCTALEQRGLTVAERVPLVVGSGPENVRYLDTKRRKMGHLFEVAAPLATAESR